MGQLDYPWLIAVDSSDDVFVVDGGPSARIQAFDPTGKVIAAWGTVVTTGGPAFDSVRGIAVDDDENIYILETPYEKPAHVIIERFIDSSRKNIKVKRVGCPEYK